MTNFIEVIDKAFTKEQCESFISLFETAKQMGLCHVRDDRTKVQDESVFMTNVHEFGLFMPYGQMLTQTFWPHYDNYCKKYGMSDFERQYHFMESFKVQKTEPSQGYHIWHNENADRDKSKRVVAWMLYLNDVTEGGETEFLYQQVRIKAKMGTLVMWPAGFTHTHRGNPPISNTKYTITSWITNG